MDQIKRLSRFLKWVFTCVFWAWPVVLLIIWFGNIKSLLAPLGLNMGSFVPGNYGYLVAQHAFPFSLTTKIFGFLVSGLPALVAMLIAFSLMRLFACYERGAVFTQESIIYIRRIGIVMFIWALLNPLYQALMTLVLTWDKSIYGMRQIGIAFGFDYFRNLILAGVVFLIAHIMREALKLKDEQVFTI